MAKLRHLAIQCDDPDATAKFFAEVFEFEEMSRIGTDLKNDGGVVYMSDGTMNVALINIVDPDFPNYEPKGLNHIGFVVKDLKETVAKANAHGAVTRRAGDEIRVGSLWEFKMETPDGIAFDLYDIYGRGWPGISGLDEFGISGTASAGDHEAGNALAGGPARSGTVE